MEIETHAGGALGERTADDVRSLSVTTRLVYVSAGAYAAVMTGASVLAFRSFGYARFDLGNMVQAVWSTAHGRLLETTSLGGEQISRLGAHADPFLALLAPLWLVWPSPLLLLILQAIAVSAGALPVFWLARKHLGAERTAAHFAFAYLLYPATQFNSFTPEAGFHPVSLAIPLILLAIWFLDQDRLLPFALTGLVAATTKEEIGLAVGLLGIWYAVRRGRRREGSAIFLVGAAITLLNFLVIIPHFAPSGFHPFADRYGSVGGSPGGIAHTAVTDPAALVHTIATGHKAFYLLLLLFPFLGLWLREPLLALGALPDLVINLLSSKPEQTTLQFQYTAGILPFLVAASIFGAAKLGRNPLRLSVLVLAACACLALHSPLVTARADVSAAVKASPTRSAKEQAVALVPSSAAVAASNQLGAMLSARRFIYVFPFVRKADWIIVDKHDRYLDDSSAAQRAYERALATYEASPDWTLVYSSRGVEVLHKRGVKQ